MSDPHACEACSDEGARRYRLPRRPPSVTLFDAPMERRDTWLCDACAESLADAVEEELAT